MAMFGQTISQALAVLESRGEPYARLLERDDCDIGMYHPRSVDDQTAHARDEIYVVATGTGEFVCEGKRERFAPGDVFFVTAGSAHKFENFSDDFATGVIFIGARP